MSPYSFLFENPLDIPIKRAPWHVPLMSVLTGFLCIFKSISVLILTFLCIRPNNRCISPCCKSWWDLAASYTWAPMSLLSIIRLQPLTLHRKAFSGHLCWCKHTWALKNIIIGHQLPWVTWNSIPEKSLTAVLMGFFLSIESQILVALTL